MPQVLFLTQSGDDLPSVRFRVLPFLRDAAARGIEAERRTIPKTLAGRIPFYASLPRSEVIILQKRLLSGLELSMLKSRCDRLVFDFDDALWATHPNSANEPGCAAREGKAVSRLMLAAGKADMVVAGNEFLAAKVGAVNDNVLILPTPIDTSAYTPGGPEHKAGAKEAPCVGWMGTSCNLFFLPEIFRVLGGLADKARFHVVSDRPFEPPEGVDVRFSYWSPETEIEHLRNMDVGLMPLTDDEYTRGKCGFKLLQYMACGAAPVASNVGFNAEIIEHGRDGFLVDTAEDFARRVSGLVEDPELRSKVAEAARKKAVEKFDLGPAAKKLWRGLGLSEP
jgi:glycosyltransferase involved in cell wall biosynthesis